MNQVFTKSMARNIYFGGSLFFILLFIGLTVDSHQRFPQYDNREAITESVANGKRIWEEYNCIGCHTLLGEGAYFAPELGNVVERYGGSKDAVKAFIISRPVNGVPNRRSMPQFNFGAQQLDDLVNFLEYVNGIDTHQWPPNKQG